MESHILANAELVRSVAQDQLGVAVEYDEAGVRWLDDYIEGQRDNASDDVKAKLPNTLGSFLGECVRHTYGGQWLEDEQTGSWAVKVNEKLSVFPFNKVRKQLAHEDGDSVLGFFTAIGPWIAHSPTGAQTEGPEAAAANRPWWKVW